MKPEDVPAKWVEAGGRAIANARIIGGMANLPFAEQEQCYWQARYALAVVAPLIAAAEREACAKVAEDMAEAWAKEWRDSLKASSHTEGQSDGADEVAAAIRARAACDPT